MCVPIDQQLGDHNLADLLHCEGLYFNIGRGTDQVGKDISRAGKLGSARAGPSAGASPSEFVLDASKSFR